MILLVLLLCAFLMVVEIIPRLLILGAIIYALYESGTINEFLPSKYRKQVKGGSPAGQTDNVVVDTCKLCKSEDGAEIPLDPFNTYQYNDFMGEMRHEESNYRANLDYPRNRAAIDAISPVFDDKAYSTNVDDSCARTMRHMQERSREAIENRARFNVNSLRPYFAEEQISAENAPWWD